MKNRLKIIEIDMSILFDVLCGKCVVVITQEQELVRWHFSDDHQRLCLVVASEDFALVEWGANIPKVECIVVNLTETTGE